MIEKFLGPRELAINAESQISSKNSSESLNFLSDSLSYLKAGS